MKVEIFVATHKKYIFPKSPIYTPIHVGSSNNKLDLDIIRDCTGENISYLNESFCELTALYWAWKNSNSDIIGLVHYRRYFVRKGSFNFKNMHILDSSFFEDQKIKSNTIILPIKGFLRQGFNFYNVEQLYIKDHVKEDWQELYNVIKKDFPDYLPSFFKVSKSYKTSLFNMMICHKDLLNKYCTWLFDILFKLEKKLDIKKYDIYQKRVFGFLAERLLNIFVEHHKQDLDIKYIRTLNIEDVSRYTLLKRKFIYLV